MGLICEGILLITGVMMLITGKFNMGQIRAQGENVRWAGVLLIMPLICGFIMGFAIASQGRGGIGFIGSQTFWAVTAIEYGMIVLAVVIAGSIIYNMRDTSPVSQSGSLPNPIPAVLTLTEAANYLRVTEQEVTALIDNGQLPAVKVGFDYRIARQALDDFIMRR